MTIIIIGITALLSISAFSNRDQMEKLLFVPYYMDDTKQWYRFVSHGFVHADWSHLIFNMMSLYFFGGLVQQIISMHMGPKMDDTVFVALYLLGMIAAAMPSYLKHRNNIQYRSLGASGAVAAVIFFSIMFVPLNKIYLMFIPIGIPAWIFGILYLATEYYLDKKQYGRVAHDAHFWGSVFGIIYAVVIYPGVLKEFVTQIASSFQ